MEQYKFLIFGDNSLECRKTFDCVINHLNKEQNFLAQKLNGGPALPIAELQFTKFIITLYSMGGYSLWTDKYPTLKEFIEYYDKPDVVIIFEKDNQIIASGEFTDTVSVGNSQWQRSQRFIAAMQNKIPFLSIYTFGEDRSQKTLREPSALLTYAYMKISSTIKVPGYLIFKKSIYSEIHNLKRKIVNLPQIEFYDENKAIGAFFGQNILYKINKNKIEMDELNNLLYAEMFNYLYYPVKKRNLTLKIIDNDLPEFKKLYNYTTNVTDLEEKKFIELCNFDWRAPSGKVANKSYFKKEICPFIKNYFKTYNKNGKFGICSADKTQNVEKILQSKYSLNNTNLLDKSKPTIIIPLQVWKKLNNSIGYSDPNGGESVLFPELLSDCNTSNSNIIFAIYGFVPTGWTIQKLYHSNQKIFRAIKKQKGSLFLVETKPMPSLYVIKNE